MEQGLTRLPVLIFAALLAGCASAPPPPDYHPPGAVSAPGRAAPDPARSRVIFTAMQMVGVPYVWGGSSPAGFDCSGLVQYAYNNAGVRLPRTAAAQHDATSPVSLDAAEPGDLLFFREGRSISHVAIYLGDGRFVHAPRGGRDVSLGTFGNSWYRAHFKRAGKVRSLAN